MQPLLDVLAVVGLFALRLGLPLVITLLVAHLLSRLDKKWEAEERAEAERASAGEKKTTAPRCWEIKGCDAVRRANCPAFRQRPAMPCWMALRLATGRLPEQCFDYAPGRTEGLRLLTDGVLQWNFWIGEAALGGLIPAFILLSARRRANDWLLMAATGLIVVGVVLNRWDVNLSGLLLTVMYVPDALRPAFAAYRPTWVEWVTVAGVVAYGLMAFTLGVRFLPVFGGAHEEAHEAPIPVEPKAVVETSAA